MAVEKERVKGDGPLDAYYTVEGGAYLIQPRARRNSRAISSGARFLPETS